MATAIIGLVVSIAGFVISLVLNAFVLDKYNAYGEVPIPGESSLHLPAGEVTVSFHTMVTGSPSSGFPVPPLGLTIKPPEGVAEPKVTENWGSTTTVNSDTHMRVWVAQIPADGTYRISTDGQVNGYINPRLAFGHSSSTGWLVWVFVGLFVVSLLDLFAGIMWTTRAARRPQPIAMPDAFQEQPWSYPTSTAPPPAPTPSPTPATGYSPSGDGARVEQLKTIAALRDSGALTEEEFQAEKRRILDTL
jgi:hypothetical protein